MPAAWCNASLYEAAFMSGGKLRAKIRSVTKLRSIVDDEDDDPSRVESIRRDGEMVACSAQIG